jgi:predicted GNAT family N-acyltransferase
MPYLRILDPAKDKIDDALTVRNVVFGEEEGLLSGPDEDEYDHLHSTRHLVIHDGSGPVATARLLFPNEQVAVARGMHFGVALEELFDLSPIAASGLRLAESGRVAVMRQHRKRAVTGMLLAGIYSVSRRASVDVWVAAANGQTAAASEAGLIHQVAVARNLDGPWRVTTREPSSPPADSSTTFLEEKDWALVRQGELHKLNLPEVLSLFLLRMGARMMGDPVYLPGFDRFAFPISCVLEEIPLPTQKWLNALMTADADRGA